MERLKVFFYNNKSWIYNIQYIFLSIILLVIVTLIDFRIIPIEHYMPDFMLMKVDLAKSILTTLAGSLLTITTFTFSTILVILNAYSSNHTPRVVENFINMKITMKVLGIFIGGFFYCVTSLVFMQNSFEQETVIAGFVSIVYSIVCIIYFVIFVQSVIIKFQGVNLIYDISEETKKVIANEVEMRTNSSEYYKQEEYNSYNVKSTDSGYLGVIDTQSILHLLDERKILFDIKVKIGEYINEDTVIAIIYSKKEDIQEETIEKLVNCFILQDTKISTFDYRYNLTKLLEIALRALSPGINDPNTAIHCINKIGVLLKPLSKINHYHIKKAEKSGSTVFYTSYTFREDLESFYLPIIEYGHTDLTVINSVLNSFRIMYFSSTSQNQDEIKRIIKHINQKVSPVLVTELEKEIFKNNLKKFYSGDEIQE